MMHRSGPTTLNGFDGHFSWDFHMALHQNMNRTFGWNFKSGGMGVLLPFQGTQIVMLFKKILSRPLLDKGFFDQELFPYIDSRDLWNIVMAPISDYYNQHEGVVTR